MIGTHVRTKTNARYATYVTRDSKLAHQRIHSTQAGVLILGSLGRHTWNSSPAW